jgi:hypothetical protein
MRIADPKHIMNLVLIFIDVKKCVWSLNRNHNKWNDDVDTGFSIIALCDSVYNNKYETLASFSLVPHIHQQQWSQFTIWKTIIMSVSYISFVLH